MYEFLLYRSGKFREISDYVLLEVLRSLSFLDVSLHKELFVPEEASSPCLHGHFPLGWLEFLL